MSAHSEAANGFVISDKALLMLNTLPESARRNIIGRAYERFFHVRGTPLASDAEENAANVVAQMASDIADKLRKRQEQSRSARAVGISRASRDTSHDSLATTAKESGEESTPPVPPTKEEGKENIIIKPARVRKVFTPPTADEVREYCTERKNGINAEDFVDFYTSKAWFVGKNKMVDWKAAVRTWERNRINAGTHNERSQPSSYGGSGFYQSRNSVGSYRGGTEAQRAEVSAVL